MATQVVELTGDEAALLRSLDKVIQKEREHERQLARTAGVGDAAGTELERALRRVEEANNKAMRGMLRDLQRLGPEGKAAADELRAQFTATGAAGFKPVDSILGDLEKLSPAAAQAAGAVREKLAEADKENAFAETLAAMQGLGGRAAEVAAGIKTELKAADNDPTAFANYLAQLSALDPAAAEAAARVQARLAESDRSDQFRETLASLRELGPEGAAIARGIEKDLKASAAESAGGMDPILRKLEELEPTAATSAARIRAELAEADARTRFDTSLAELRKINPAAAKAAEAVRTELSQADKEVKFDSIIAELQELDPASAEAARKLRDNMKAGAEGAGDAIGKFTEFAKGKVAALVTSFGGVTALLSQIQAYADEQTQHQKDAGDYQTRLAAAQQEAMKGYVGLTAEERDFYLNKAPFQIASNAGVSDVPEIVRALGNIDSSATTEQAVAAVEAAARINLMTTDKITDFAVGAIGLGRATGIDDPASNIALMVSTREDAFVDDLQKLANILGPAVAAGVATVPQQDRVEASLDTAALWAVMNKGLADAQGNETATASNTLNARLASFFSGLETEMIESRSAIESLQNQIARSEGEQKKDRAERERLLQLIAAGEKSITPDRSELDKRIAKEQLDHEGREIDARAKIKAIDAKPAADVTEKDRFERRNLATFLSQSQSQWEEQKAKLEKEWEQKQANAESQRAERLRTARKQLEAIELRLSTTSEFEKQLAELARHQAFLADAEGFRDPATVLGRVEALQQKPGLREQFYSDSFGGEKARPVFQALTDADHPLAKELAEVRERINADPDRFEDLAAEVRAATPSLRRQTYKSGIETGINVGLATDNEAATIGDLQDTLAKTLASTRPEGFARWIFAQFNEMGIKPNAWIGSFGGLDGDSAAEKSVDAIGRLLWQREVLVGDGIEPSEIPKIEIIDKAVDGIRTLILDLEGTLKEGSFARAAERAESSSRRFRVYGETERADYFAGLAADFRRVAEALETQNRMIAEQTELQAQTAENTTPQPAPPPDYHAITGGSLAQEDAR